MGAERLLGLFERLVAIESPSWHEAEMAKACKEELEQLGFDVSFDGSARVTGSDTGNLIAYRKGDAAGAVAFSAHMDTVKPCEDIQICRIEDERGEVLCSEGATILSADDKAGVAAIFEGIRTALEGGQSLPDIHVLLITCEEQSLLGSAALSPDDLPQGIDCFVLDADGAPGSVIGEAPCHRTMRVLIKGRSAHAGVEPEVGISAIQAAAASVCAMELGRLDDATTANIGIIEGGVAVNIVPEACRLEGECRSIFPKRADEVQEQMTAAVRQACERFGAEADITWEQDYPAVRFTSDSPIINKARIAIEDAGLPFQMVRTGGGADANNLNGKGINAVTLGTGMANFHSTDEYIRVQDLVDDARLVCALIKAYAA